MLDESMKPRNLLIGPYLPYLNIQARSIDRKGLVVICCHSGNHFRSQLSQVVIKLFGKYTCFFIKNGNLN